MSNAPVTEFTGSLASWQEPETSDLVTGRLPLPLWLGTILLLGIGLALIGYFQHDFTYYLAAIVAFVASLALYAQNHRPSGPRQIVLSQGEIAIGQKHHALGDLAGFWLEPESNFTVVNLEPNKPSMMPISLLPPDGPSKVRELFLRVISEVEPRHSNFADQVNRYIRL